MLTPEEVVRATELAESGMPIRQVAATLGRPYTSVYRVLRDAGATRPHAESLRARRANTGTTARECVCEGRCPCHRFRRFTYERERLNGTMRACPFWDVARPTTSCLCLCHDQARELLRGGCRLTPSGDVTESPQPLAGAASSPAEVPAAPQPQSPLSPSLPDHRAKRDNLLLWLTQQGIAEAREREMREREAPSQQPE